jgi:hypothetical protein
MASQNNMEQGTPGYSVNRNDEIFLSLNLLGSEYYDEISQERHKSMTLKCGCVTPAAEASTR